MHVFSTRSQYHYSIFAIFVIGNPGTLNALFTTPSPPPPPFAAKDLSLGNVLGLWLDHTPQQWYHQLTNQLTHTPQREENWWGQYFVGPMRKATKHQSIHSGEKLPPRIIRARAMRPGMILSCFFPINQEYRTLTFLCSWHSL